LHSALSFERRFPMTSRRPSGTRVLGILQSEKALLRQVTSYLLDEEWIAFGLLLHRIRKCEVHLFADQTRHHLAHVTNAEPAEWNARRPIKPLAETLGSCAFCLRRNLCPGTFSHSCHSPVPRLMQVTMWPLPAPDHSCRLSNVLASAFAAGFEIAVYQRT
jgi:hypothetical protein